jgi:hypothetical protein
VIIEVEGVATVDTLFHDSVERILCWMRVVGCRHGEIRVRVISKSSNIDLAEVLKVQAGSCGPIRDVYESPFCALTGGRIAVLYPWSRSKLM